MPQPFQGRINGTVRSVVYNLPFSITFFTIANKEAGNVTVNVTVSNDNDELAMIPNNMELEAGDFLQSDSERILKIGSRIKVVSSGNVDFYFNLKNIDI